jgi:hypothetical protein
MQSVRRDEGPSSAPSSPPANRTCRWEGRRASASHPFVRFRLGSASRSLACPLLQENRLALACLPPYPTTPPDLPGVWHHCPTFDSVNGQKQMRATVQAAYKCTRSTQIIRNPVLPGTTLTDHRPRFSHQADAAHDDCLGNEETAASEPSSVPRHQSQSRMNCHVSETVRRRAHGRMRVQLLTRFQTSTLILLLTMLTRTPGCLPPSDSNWNRTALTGMTLPSVVVLDHPARPRRTGTKTPDQCSFPFGTTVLA